MTIQQTIMTEVAARIASISSANGYNTTIGSVFVSRENPFEPSEVPAARILLGGIAPAETTAAKRYMRETHDLNLTIQYAIPLTSMTYFDATVTASMDVWTALNRTTSAPMVSDEFDHNLGGLASRLGLISVTGVLVDQQTIYGGADVEIGISYEIDIRDPFTAI